MKKEITTITQSPAAHESKPNGGTTDTYYADEYLKSISWAAAKIDQNKIQEIIKELFKAWENKNNVFLIGNGGSATIAMHFATDLGKGTYCEGKERLHTFCLSENADLITALTNDNGWENVYTDQLKGLIKEGDILIAYSVHGGSGKDKAGAWSQNILKAIDLAKNQKAITIGLAGFDGGAMKDFCDLCLVVPARITGQVQDLQMAVMHIICDILMLKIKNHEE